MSHEHPGSSGITVPETIGAGVPRWMRGLSYIFFLLGCSLLLMVCLIAWKGGRWEWGGISASSPGDRLAGAAACLIIWLMLRDGFKRPRKEWVSLFGRIFLLTASLGLAFFMAERLLRIHLRNTQGFSAIEDLTRFHEGRNVKVQSQHALTALVRVSANSKLIYELKPRREFRFAGRRFKSNSMGMRDSLEYAEHKPAGTVRIIGIGDSGMFGWGNHQDEDYLAVLEANLNSKSTGPRYEVLNTAVPGYNTQQELEAFKSKWLAFAPDIVVIGWCNNDFDLPFFLYGKNDFDDRDVSYFYEFLFDRKTYRELIEPRVLPAKKIDENLVDPELLLGEGEDGVGRALGELKRLGEAHGFKIIGFGPLGSRAIRVFEKVGVDYYSTSREIPKDKYPREYFIHFMHPAASGHKVLATHLEDALRTRGWL